MKPVAALSVLGLLTGCAGHLDPVVDAGPAPAFDLSAGLASNARVCRIGTDDGPVVADRGIGGTGAPPATPGAERVADRGIGGTGIIGVVTGFASICVNGLEVRYDASARVDIDGDTSSVAALRAGQVVVIQAQGIPAALQARTISIRREVAGRIDAVEPATGTLTVAGQPVSVPGGTWGGSRFHVGDWVAVSGLRRTDGMIVASRLDSAPADAFSVHGQVTRDGNGVRVGAQVLQGPNMAGLADGQFITASGRYVAGQLQTSTLTIDPAAYSGLAGSRISVQAFVHVANAVVSFNGLHVPAGPDLQGQSDSNGLAIVWLERKPDGTMVAAELQHVDYHGAAIATGRPSGAVGSGLGSGDAFPSPTGHVVRSMRSTQPSAGGGVMPAIGSPAIAPAPVAKLPATPALGSGPSVSSPAGLQPVAPAAAVAAPALPTQAVPEQTPKPAMPAVTSGAPIESAPSGSDMSGQPSTNDLISSNPSLPEPTTVVSAAPKTGRVARVVRAARKVIASGSTSPPTISLATGAVTPAVAATGAGAASASSAARPGGTTVPTIPTTPSVISSDRPHGQ